MSEFKWNLGIFLEFIFFSVLITISMNLFDQLVIIICNPYLRGLASLREESVIGIIVCSAIMLFWV